MFIRRVVSSVSVVLLLFVLTAMSAVTVFAAGEAQKAKYNKMLISDKINLLTNTLLNCASYDDFEADIVINFDYNNY